MKTKLELTYVEPNYGTNTLLNGNVSECIRYLKDLIASGEAGASIAHDELVQIKDQAPEKYSYIKKQVFNPLYRAK